MKFLDKVKVINLKESYEKENVKLNDVGVIWEAEIRDNSFYVMFDDNSDEKFYNEKKGETFFKYSIIKASLDKYIELATISQTKITIDKEYRIIFFIFFMFFAP